jgi:hypothetical protein
MVIAAVTSIFVRIAQVRPVYRYPYPKVLFRYEVVSRTITYRIDSEGLLHYSKTIRVRALRGRLEEFIDRFAWTGHRADYPRPGHGVLRIDPVEGRVGIWKYFRVYFGHSLAKGQEHEFTIEWDPISDWTVAQPFVSVSTDEPTEKVRFLIEIPCAAVHEGVAFVEVLRAVESIEPFSSERVEFDEFGRLAWEVDQPYLYHHFRVRWFWSKEILALSQRAVSIPGQSSDRPPIIPSHSD